MTKYSVPDEIRKYRPDGTMIKFLHNKYYVYEYSCYKNDCGKWITKMGKIIGKITSEDGFVPNSNYVLNTEITTLEYGQYSFLINSSKSIINDLLNVFNQEEAYMLYYLGIIHVANGFQYLKAIQDLFEQSYLSLLRPNISLRYEKVSNLLYSLGQRQTKVFEYEQNCINNSSKNLIIDGHVISSTSHNNDLAEFGNKYSSLKDMQLNVLMIYDLEKNNPLTSRIYSGSTLDKVSVKDLMDIHSFNDVLFIVDRGFYSKENITSFSSNGNHYIIPLSPNMKEYKDVTKDLKFKKMFIYENNKKRTSVEYKEYKYENKKIIVYRDNEQYLKDNQDFLKNMEKNPTKYTTEKYNEVKDFFGIIVLETNLGKGADEIYRLYKKRWKIETFYNYFKNKIDISSLELNDYYKTQGLSFIMLITSQIYEEIRKNIANIKGKNIDDIIRETRFLKLNKTKNSWKVSNAKKELQILMKTLNIDLTNPVK